VKSKAHTVYKLKDGTRVPGTTTITGGELGWNKQVLVSWANKKGLEGIETSKFVDNLAEIGTLAHQLVLDHFLKKETDTSDYSKNQIDAARNCLDSYWNWEKGKTIETRLLETPLVSEQFKFGGTLDCYALIDGKLTLLDFKTGKGIYDEYFVQVAGGYLLLLEENGMAVESIQILNIPRSEGESFQIESLPKEKWLVCKSIFLNCLNNYNLKKQLRKD
jgi:hypothetical protein